MSRVDGDLTGPIRLDLNTVPFLNEVALRTACRSTDLQELAMYPEPDSPSLTRALASRLGVRQESILIGNGSDEILDLVIRALIPRGGSIGILLPSFNMYEYLARANGRATIQIPAEETLPVERLTACGADGLILASPNNPTGSVFAREDFEALADETQGPVVIDEAYAEFARQDLRPLAFSRDNVIVIRTFSKAYGLPGIRVGYAVGAVPLLGEMRAIKTPYNVSSISEQVALAALAEDSFPSQTVDFIASERSRLFESLKRSGWPVWPSQANFLLVGPSPQAAKIRAALKDRKVLVKLVDWPGGETGSCIRITVGTAAQNQVLLAALEEMASYLS